MAIFSHFLLFSHAYRTLQNRLQNFTEPLTELYRTRSVQTEPLTELYRTRSVQTEPLTELYRTRSVQTELYKGQFMLPLNQRSNNQPIKYTCTFQELSTYCDHLQKKISRLEKTIQDMTKQLKTRQHGFGDVFRIQQLEQQLQMALNPPKPITPPKPIQYPTSYKQAECFHSYPGIDNNQLLPQLFGFLLYIQTKQKKDKPHLYWRASRKIQEHWHHIHICPAPNLSTLPNQLFEIAQKKIACYLRKYKITPEPYQLPIENSKETTTT